MGNDTQPTLDLEALLAIVRQRTPGEWLFMPEPPGCSVIGWIHARVITPSGIAGRGDLELGSLQSDGSLADGDAIVAAVNNIEPLAERCKRAEEWNDYDSTIAELTRQRDELQNRCGELWELLHEASAFVPHDVEMVLFDQIQVALDKGAFVKGGADDKA